MRRHGRPRTRTMSRCARPRAGRRTGFAVAQLVHAAVPALLGMGKRRAPGRGSLSGLRSPSGRPAHTMAQSGDAHVGPREGLRGVEPLPHAYRSPSALGRRSGTAPEAPPDSARAPAQRRRRPPASARAPARRRAFPRIAPSCTRRRARVSTWRNYLRAGAGAPATSRQSSRRRTGAPAPSRGRSGAVCAARRRGQQGLSVIPARFRCGGCRTQASGSGCEDATTGRGAPRRSLAVLRLFRRRNATPGTRDRGRRPDARGRSSPGRCCRRRGAGRRSRRAGPRNACGTIAVEHLGP